MATVRERSRVGVDVASFTAADWLVIGLGALSGAVHLYLYATEEYLPFLLAGVGFFGAIALLAVLPGYRRYLYPIGLLFVLAQIAGYLAMGAAFDTPLWLDALDKLAQLLLVVLLSWLTYVTWSVGMRPP